MSANVRCAGNEQWAAGGPPPGRYELPVTPCTWTGERYPDVLLYEMSLEQAISREPCPRCGGRVELIAEANTSTNPQVNRVQWGSEGGPGDVVSAPGPWPETYEGGRA